MIFRNLAMWAFIGAVVGWLGFRLAGEKHAGCLTTIVVGIGGAMFGSAMFTMVSGWNLLTGTGPREIVMSFVASVVGAAVLVLVLRLLGRQEG